ncbi:SxtJ family membrane protein [Thermodesulfobacteriota bacterium]
MKKNKIAEKEAKDTGLAFVLIILLLIQFMAYDFLILPAIGLTVLTMTWPTSLKPLARLWIGMSHFLGVVVSKIILTVLFFTIVTPVGLFRRRLGADPMCFKLWKKGEGSLFNKCDKSFSKEELEKAY